MRIGLGRIIGTVRVVAPRYDFAVPNFHNSNAGKCENDLPRLVLNIVSALDYNIQTLRETRMNYHIDSFEPIACMIRIEKVCGGATANQIWLTGLLEQTIVGKRIQI